MLKKYIILQIPMEIGRLINEFLKISLDLKLSNIIGEIKYITKQIDEGTFEWN